MLTVSPALRDLAILLGRIGLGVIFLAHGWQKLFTVGIGPTAAFFKLHGVPLPTLAAWAAALVELIGGAALIIGLAVPIAGILLFLDMLGAYIFVKAGHGLFTSTGGAELELSLGSGSLLLAGVGAGRYSIDALISRSRAGPTRAHRA
jgi:putative oxidoreductase